MQIHSACRSCRLIQNDDSAFHCSDCPLIPNHSSNRADKSQQPAPAAAAIVNRSAVEAVLMKIGMPVSLKGFAYITDAVLLLDTPDWKNQKWTALYYKIALLNNTTATRVEKAIRNAFSVTRAQPASYALAERYIGMTNCENSNSLLYLYKSMQQESCLLQSILRQILSKKTVDGNTLAENASAPEKPGMSYAELQSLVYKAFSKETRRTPILP